MYFIGLSFSNDPTPVMLRLQRLEEEKQREQREQKDQKALRELRRSRGDDGNSLDLAAQSHLDMRRSDGPTRQDALAVAQAASESFTRDHSPDTDAGANPEEEGSDRGAEGEDDEREDERGILLEESVAGSAGGDLTGGNVGGSVGSSPRLRNLNNRGPASGGGKRDEELGTGVNAYRNDLYLSFEEQTGGQAESSATLPDREHDWSTESPEAGAEREGGSHHGINGSRPLLTELSVAGTHTTHLSSPVLSVYIYIFTWCVFSLCMIILYIYI